MIVGRRVAGDHYDDDHRSCALLGVRIARALDREPTLAETRDAVVEWCKKHNHREPPQFMGWIEATAFVHQVSSALKRKR